MSCPNGCKTDMDEIKKNHLYFKNNKPILVKDLLTKICPECGQEALPLNSMRIIDDIIHGKCKSIGKVQTLVYQVAKG